MADEGSGKMGVKDRFKLFLSRTGAIASYSYNFMYVVVTIF